MASDRVRARREVRAGRLPLVAGLAALAALLCGACGTSGDLTAAVSSPPGVGAGNPLSTVWSAATTIGTTTVTGPTLTTPRAARATVSAGGDAAVAPTSTRQGFLGIASELSTITMLSGTPRNPDTPLVQLLKNLSPGAPFLLRLGGDSADWSWWAIPGVKQPAAIRYTLTPEWGADVKALLTALGGTALLGVNLELDSKRVAAYEVKQYGRYVGSQLIDGYELGNEPELYAAFNYYKLANGSGVKGREFGHYTLADYAKDFTNIASALGDIPLIGPSSGSADWLPDLGTMLSDLPSRLKLVTVHAYPLKHCSASAHVSIPELVSSASIQGLAGEIQTMVSAAAAHGKALRLDEINGVTCGGAAGVSNSFGEALWALNMLPALWQAGVQGVNFQTIDSNLNDMITATQSAGAWHVSVEPEYYGLLTFADVAPAGSHLLKISDPAYPGFYQYAVRAPGGEEHVVLTNVSSHSRSIGVSASGTAGAGEVARLSAPSLGSTAGTTLAGQRLSSSTGQLTGGTRYTLVKPNAKGVYAVTVPAHSAAILTVGS
jgi:hypothetical protein